VHHSWWVSDAAVESFERFGRGGVMRLKNGLHAPVSQRYLKIVEAAFSRAIGS
jgi:DNA-binding LytR/AlgR family response regulator